MSSMVIPVSFIAGTSIDSAIFEALALSQRLNTNVEFNFNSYQMFVLPTSEVDKLREQYDKWRVSL